MGKRQSNVAYVYRGLGRDIPWQRLIRDICVSAECDAPIALVITRITPEDDRAPGNLDAGEVRRSEKRLTLVDVAHLAGVSKTTVSRVLNNQDHVRPEVRAHVKAVVEAVGFSLNESARALVLGRR